MSRRFRLGTPCSFRCALAPHTRANFAQNARPAEWRGSAGVHTARLEPDPCPTATSVSNVRAEKTNAAQTFRFGKPLRVQVRACAPYHTRRSTKRAANGRRQQRRGFHPIFELAPYIILRPVTQTPARPLRQLPPEEGKTKERLWRSLWGGGGLAQKPRADDNATLWPHDAPKRNTWRRRRARTTRVQEHCQAP